MPRPTSCRRARRSACGGTWRCSADVRHHDARSDQPLLSPSTRLQRRSTCRSRSGSCCQRPLVQRADPRDPRRARVRALLACRYYGVDASLPYFLPVPFVLTGTFGAFIRIRQPIPTKRAVRHRHRRSDRRLPRRGAGALLIGMYCRTSSAARRLRGQLLELGEPLLFNGRVADVRAAVPRGYSVNMHPVALAAWFGLLATALNLFPVGQTRRRSHLVRGRAPQPFISSQPSWCLIGLSFVSTVVDRVDGAVVAMLSSSGPHHPRTVDEDMPARSARCGSRSSPW